MNDTLLLFDIDGTLIHVAEEIAYVQAFRELYGAAIDASWPPNVTASDTSYIGAVIARALGRTATAEEIAHVVTRFVTHLERTIVTGVAPVRRLAGAAEFVAACAQTAPVAIATGCVEPSARVKLRYAELEHLFPCGGFSTSETRRADIVQRAIAVAERHYGRRFAPAHIVSFGDGVWDVEAARELGLRFVGINESERGRQRLAAAGAEVVVRDFTDAAAIWRIIKTPSQR
ncbi:MAG: HAD family hydrolase [Deltaproteobacteria bacterium]|nr:HAD family hydrolase [Deltaproteobacteria bacterium]MBI3387853.1 HAD family hydrolase [Deltaproteobacteria bacterium]